MQRALMQYYLPANRALAAEALRIAHRTDLIGPSENCLIRQAFGDRNRTNAGNNKKGGKQHAKQTRR